MVLMGYTPTENSISFTYRFSWLMDREHCLYFIDALISNTLAEGGKFGDLVIRDDIESEQFTSLRDEYLTNEGDLFTTIADCDIATVGVVLCSPEEDVQFFIEVAIDTDVCNVHISPISEDAEISENSSPDLLLDRSEILAHVTFTCANKEDFDEDEDKDNKSTEAEE